MKRKRRAAKSSADGFTLIEVLITLTVFSIGLLGVATMLISSINGNAFAAQTTEGSSLAHRKIEELVALPYNHADLEDTGGAHTDPSPPAGYGVSWTVDEDTPIDNTKQVVVTVTWQRKGTTRTSTLVWYKKDLI